MSLLFVTSNAEKFANAQTICAKYGFEVEQLVVDIDEIQGEHTEAIVRDKARKAYELVGKPVIVSDDSWNIVGLNGFPGVYMKSVSHWFTPHDFINLMRDIKNRTAILHQCLVYQDGHEGVIFQHDHVGQVVSEPRGESKTSWHCVIAMDADNGKTLAEVIASGGLNNPARSSEKNDAWDDLLKWLKGEAK